MEDRQGEDLANTLLSDQLKRVGWKDGLLVLVVMAALTYTGLVVLVKDDAAPRPVTAVPAKEPRAVSAPTSTSVGSISVGENGVEGSGVVGRKAEQLQRTPADDQAPATAPVAAAAAKRPGTDAIRRAAGQTLVGRFVGKMPSARFLARVRRGELGGVILFSDNIGTRRQVAAALDQLQETARNGGNPALLVAVDQEGGAQREGGVKRFADLPPTRSASAMGRLGPGVTREEGLATGSALRGLGVNVDLAPVSDVPSGSAGWLGVRAFGRTSAAVAQAACGFAAGLTDAGVAATLKHFPGLGLAPANTDFDNVTIAASPGQLAQGWEPYRRCGGAPKTIVMVSSARYTQLTNGAPAVLSPKAYAVLGRLTGRRALTISDDLQTPAITPIPGVAVKAVNAGLDLQLYAKTEGASDFAFRRLVAGVGSRQLSATRLLATARRIEDFKTQIGLSG